MSDVDLKPCPFCGAIPILHKNKVKSGDFIYSIACNNFRCAISPSTLFSKNKNEVLDFWNIRNQ